MMTKNNDIRMLLALVGCMLLAGCSSEESGKTTPSEPAQVETLTIDGLDDTHWVYISLETGTKVGTSLLGDAEQDAAWKSRADWDIALCGELVRTNGGTSGRGQAALQTIPSKSFNALDEAPAEGYISDTDDITIRQ